MPSRVLTRLLAIIGAVVVAVAVIPATPAAAHTHQPPFQIVFPQEPGSTEFSDSFGDSRSGGRSHKGTDLLAPRMTEIYSIAPGTVTYVGTNNLSGRNMKIDHGDGWESYYVHLNNDNIGTDDGRAPWSLTVAPGIEEAVEVEAGQLIGWVGDSGNAEGTTPHTHFEWRLNGGAINPYSLLVEAYDRALVLVQETHLASLDYEME